MSQDLYILLGTAAAIGFLHTIMGPDHYLPFVALSKARAWSTRRTLLITIVCGTAHVLGSVVLAAIGIAAGLTLSRISFVESARGEIAAWLLIAFGLVYATWGIVRAARNKPHTHGHVHADGTSHVHKHVHKSAHAHLHDHPNRNLTAWTLFIVFVLGPCEALIPLLMFPAAAKSVPVVALVALVFGVATVATMTAVVWVSLRGLSLIPSFATGRYSHAVAGTVILLCGVAIRLGL